MIKLLFTAFIMAACAAVFAQEIQIRSIPYDALVIHTDGTGKNILDRKNCPAIYAGLSPSDMLFMTRKGYIYRGRPLKAEKKPAYKELFVELAPVTFVAKDDFKAAAGATDKLLNYMELYPMLADGEFYFAFYKAMEKNAVKNKSFGMKNIMGDVVYKDEANGVCAVTSVNFDMGAKQSPMAPAAAGDSGVKNALNIYFFGADGKLRYQIERNCRKYISFAAVFDGKKKVLNITEDYVTLYLNNMQGDIHVKLEYSVALPSLKFNFETITYYTELEGKEYMPVKYAVGSGADHVKNNK